MRRTAVRLPCLFRLCRNMAGDSAPLGRFPFIRRAGRPHPAVPIASHCPSGIRKGTPSACLFSCASRTHKIGFALQNHKNRGHVPRFLYSEREKVSEWELLDVRVLRSQNTDCRKTLVFRQALAPLWGAFLLSVGRGALTPPSPSLLIVPPGYEKARQWRAFFRALRARIK